MKRIILLLMIAFVATVYSHAQQIAVVSTDGATSLYQTLGEAINGASAGSVIYLPGGGFPISDDVKITKKLTIIGIGHKIMTDNADGYTTISGNLFFNEGSDGSAVMGAYITGNVKIGDDGNKVDNVLVRYCNLNQFVSSSKCLGIVVNQNYIRDSAHFGSGPAVFTNNITNYVRDLDNGTIANNIFVGRYYGSSINICDNCSIKYNVLGAGIDGSNNFADGNMAPGIFFNDPDGIDINNIAWTDIFVNPDGVKPTSNYHFKGDYVQYENQVGIYGGTGFSDSALPPVPYISAKRIDEQTDAAGNLTIKIRVKAGGEE